MFGMKSNAKRLRKLPTRRLPRLQTELLLLQTRTWHLHRHRLQPTEMASNVNLMEGQRTEARSAGGTTDVVFSLSLLHVLYTIQTTRKSAECTVQAHWAMGAWTSSISFETFGFSKVA